MLPSQDRLAHLRLRGAVLFIVVVATALSIVAAVLQWMVDPGFDTFGDSLWWAVETVSTVGYGDVVPESAAGKAVASALMLVGIGFIPVLTSVVVSVLVAQRAEREREVEQKEFDKLLSLLTSLDERLARLELRDGPGVDAVSRAWPRAAASRRPAVDSGRASSSRTRAPRRRGRRKRRPSR